MLTQVNDALIYLRNALNKKTISENENPDKILNVIEKILDF